jgi:F420-non-reducing hydrogenase small subunit
MVLALLNNQLPPVGSVLAPDISLCETCPKRFTKSDVIKFKEIKDFTKVITDTKQCFLEDGVICMGPVTRSGCGERCINVNIPCRGCFGPTSNIYEQGAKFISAMGMTLDLNDEDKIAKVAETFRDIIGVLYQYSLSKSFLKGSKEKKNG